MTIEVLKRGPSRAHSGKKINFSGRKLTSDDSKFSLANVNISDSKRYFSLYSANLIVGLQESTTPARISTSDRVRSRCSKWVRDYPAGSHKH